MVEVKSGCMNCDGERTEMCRELFYEAATMRFDHAGAAEALLELSDPESAEFFMTDLEEAVGPKLKRRLSVIGCALTHVEIDVKLQSKIEEIYGGTDGS